MSPKHQLPVLGSDMRAVRRDLAGASDQHVLEVLHMVDQLADRSRADGLLAPLRGRLRELRPARPLRFARLLMTPLEPVLVDPRVWRPGAPQLPRNAIPAIVALTQSALPFIAAEVDRISAQSHTPRSHTPGSHTPASQASGSHIMGASGTDLPSGMPCAAGRILWADAAAVLRSSPVPPEWSATGLPNTAFRDLARGCGTALAAAWELQLAADPAIPAVELNETLADLLAAAEADGPVGWGMRLTMMLQRFPHATAPLQAAAGKRANRDMRQAAETAMEAAWAWIETASERLDDDNLPAVTIQLKRQVTLLGALASDMTHRRRATALQTNLRGASMARFDAALETLLLSPLRLMSPAEAGTDDFSSHLEESARALRRLDVECRRLGSGATLDARMNDAAALITRRADMPAMDRARLVEILLGAQAALRLASFA
jgi:hypothetical protein